ncbi:MAG: RNA polymerase sigma factor, partial [candidate division WOR-3 bacterium]|nr:RNA polymerase sigma factor [candidate division WOR-3 bacterium]
PKRSFRSWALGFARNLGYYYLRSRKRAPKMVSFDAMPEEEQPTMPGPEDDHEQIVAVEEALRIVEPLPKIQQVAVLGYVCDEMSYKELAELTGRKPGTLQSDVHRGLQTLRRRMG